MRDGRSRITQALHPGYESRLMPISSFGKTR
jgi:hypothetical protein